MSKELKNIIDVIDEKDKSQTQMLSEIELLKEELKRFKFKVKEQKHIIKEQRSKLQMMEKNDIPEDIQILKEMVISQRQELVKKEKDLEILSRNLEAVQINEQNILSEQKERISELEQKLYRFNEFKREKLQLEEQIKSLRSQNLDLQKEIVGKNNVEEDENQLEFLKEEIRRFEKVNDKLQEELLATSENLHSVLEKRTTTGNLESELKRLKKREVELEKKIEELESKPDEIQDDDKIGNEKPEDKHKSPQIDDFFDQFDFNKNSVDLYQFKVILKLFSGYNKEIKNKIINRLILDLKNEDIDIKKFVIEFLGEIRDETAFKALMKLAKENSENWIARYALVRALNKYDSEEASAIIKQFLRDNDVDVRELAEKIYKARLN